jgi:cellulose 1,4-beta-cellobiosidase
MFTNSSSSSTYGIQLSELALLAYSPAPPSAPTNLSATAGNAQVALNWDTSSGATRYNLKRSTTSGGPYTFNMIASQTTTSYTDTNVVNGTSYCYVVSSVNTNGESGNSLQVSARPVSQVSTNLTFATSSGHFQLTWPQDHTGWTLQMQTNSLDTGLGTNWVDVTNSILTNQLIIPFNTTNGGVFFRLKYP